MKDSFKMAIGMALAASLFMAACGGSEAALPDDAEAVALYEEQQAEARAKAEAAAAEAAEAEAAAATAPPANDFGIDACALIKNSEITEIWGVQVETVEKDNGCEWREPGATAADWNSFRLVLGLQGGGRAGLQASVKAMEEFASDGYKVSKMDVGDEGYQDGSIAMFAVGDTYVSLAAMFNKEIDFKTPAPVELAKKVAARI